MSKGGFDAPMRERDRAFRKLTGLTPVDLEDNALDLQKQLAQGARNPKLATAAK